MDALPKQVDLLVVGGGMAGLSAAALACEAGARVLVLEKGERPGGSAALSSGIFWTAPDRETLRREVPLGDSSVGGAVVDDYDGAVEALRAAGVSVTERFGGVMRFGVGHRIDIAAWLERAARTVDQRGSQVACRCVADRLIVEQGEVRGALARPARARRPGTPVRARACLLATGGFQGARELLAAFVGPASDRLLFRSNPGSVGDGFRLGMEVGAAASGGLGTFYGHLIPAPLRRFTSEDFSPLTQYHSRFCVLVNRRGERFCDETLGDDRNNQALLRQPEARGVLICDEAIRTAHVITPAIPHTEAVDRFAAAAAAGAHLASGDLETIVQAVSSWGFPAAPLRATLRAAPFQRPPFHALEVQPSITYSYGGLRVDPDGRVLDRDGLPVSGLFAAGADAGGVSNESYAGGLAPAFILGRRAARAALR
jgi:succinate dehydrogenase/fumarate reductase flavoprotein subunit